MGHFFLASLFSKLKTMPPAENLQSANFILSEEIREEAAQHKKERPEPRAPKIILPSMLAFLSLPLQAPAVSDRPFVAEECASFRA